MRNALPHKPNKNECAVVNLDDKDGPGTHWVAYVKRENKIVYFDSFGDLKPPNELIKYFGPKTCVLYNHEKLQNYNTYNCGHLCLKFLINNSTNTKF